MDARGGARVTDCRLILVFCCEGRNQQPAHGHRPTPCCPCGWIGEEHTSQLEANREGTTHLLSMLPEMNAEITGQWKDVDE